MTNKSYSISLIKSGEKATFESMYHEYYGLLYHLGFQYLQDEDEAKEVVQHTFLKLWEQKEQLNPNSNIRNYLFTLVKNNCLNQIKRRQLILNHNEKIKRIELNYQFESLNRMTADYMEVKELKEKIDSSIEKLPSHCKKVFCMSRFNGLKNAEIADELNISTKTVEAHMTKALKILRTELKDYLPFAIFSQFFL